MTQKSTSLETSLHQLDAAITRRLEQASALPSRHEVTSTNVHIIRYLRAHENEPVYQRDLEREFGITRSTASRVLSLMERKGLIVRAEARHDARLKQVTLTDKARSFDATMHTNICAMEQQLMDGFTPEEKTQLLHFLHRMRDNLLTAEKEQKHD